MNKKCLAIAFAMALTLTIAFAPRARANPIDISFEPTSGTVGTLVSVSGSADTQNGFVDIYWDLPGNVFLTVQAEGAYYEAEIQIPNAVAGTHAIGVKDVQAGTTAAENFIVIPSFTLTQNAGRIGLTVAVSGTGFASSSSVTITWDDPAQTVLETQSNETGTFDGSFIVPSCLAGDHTVTATDVHGNTDSDTFTVLPMTISIEPDSGPVGTEVAVTGTNATPSGSISIRWDDVEDGSATADDIGNYSYTLTVQPASAGEHTITAVDVTSTNNASETFTLLPITISIDQVSGPVGTTVAVTGTYATPDGSVAIQWDDVVVYTVVALLDGTYSYELMIPPATKGDHTITAVDVASTNTASETFTVIALITLDPEYGLGGDIVLVTGRGFSGNSEVNVYFDIDQDGVPDPEELVVADVPTNETGSFESEFAVPWVSIAGNYLVIAIDAEGVTDDATFTVLFVAWTRSNEYFQGDYPSFYMQTVDENGKSLEGAFILVNIYDSTTYLQYKGITFTSDDGTVPYDMQFFNWYVWYYWETAELSPLHLSSDAPIGTWTWTTTANGLTVSGSFEVIEPVDLRTLLSKLDQLLEGQDDIAGLITYYGDKLQLEHDELADLIAAVSNELQMDHEELANLVSDVFAALELKLDDISDEIIGIEEKVDGLYLVIGDLEVKLDDINPMLTDIQGRIGTMETDVGTIKTDISSINGHIATIEGDIVTIETDIGTIKTDISAIDGRLTSIEGGVATIQTAIGDIEVKLDETVIPFLEAIEAKLDVMGPDVIVIKTAIGDVETKLDDTVIPLFQAVNARIVSFEEKVDEYYLALNTTIGEIVFKVDPGVFVYLEAIEAKLDFINATTVRIETVIGDVEVKLEDISDFLDDIKAEIIDIEDKIDGTYLALNTTLGEIEVKLEYLNANLVAIHGDTAEILVRIGTPTSTIFTELSSIKARITEVEEHVATIETDIGTIKVDLIDLNTKITVTNDNIATIETDIGTIKGRLTSIEGDVATIETDIGTIQTTTDSIQTTGESIKTDTSLQPATVALSLIAAISAIAAAVMVLRKVYVK